MVLHGFVTEMLETTKVTRADDKEHKATASLDITSYYINDPDYTDDMLGKTLINSMVADSRSGEYSGWDK